MSEPLRGFVGFWAVDGTMAGAAVIAAILLFGLPPSSPAAADGAPAAEDSAPVAEDSAPAAEEDELPFDRSTVREYVLGNLSEMAGRELEVTGDIDIDLAWTPSMRLEGVRVANADWAQAPYLLEIEALELELDMRAIMNGDVRLPRLTLIRPTLFLEVSEDGDANWIMGGGEQTVVESAAAPSGKPGNLPRIDLLQVTSGELAYLNHGDADAQWVRGEISDVDGKLDDEGVDLGVSGRLGGDSFTIELRTASMSALRAGTEPNPLFLLATSGASRLRVEGTLVAPFELRGIDLALQAHGPGFNQLPLLTGLPESPAFELDGRLRGDSADWRLSELSATIGRSEMSGEVGLDLTGERPLLTADLTAETLVVDELLALAPERERDEVPDPPDEGIDLSVLAALDADVQAEAQILEFQRWRLSQVRSRLRIDDGVLSMTPLSAAAGGGRIAADLTLATDPIAGQARVEIDSVNLEEALNSAGAGAGEAAGDPLGVLDGTLLVVLPPADDRASDEDRISDTAGPVLHPARALERLRVQAGRLSYREPDRQTELGLTLAAGEDDVRPNIGVEGRFRGLAVDGALNADPLPALVGDEPYGAQGRLSLGDMEATFEAALLSPPSLQQFRLDFGAQGELAPVGAVTGLKLPPAGQLAGELRRDGAVWTLRDLQAQVGDSDLSGRIRVDAGGERPQIDLDLRSETLDLPSLMPEGMGAGDGGDGDGEGDGSPLEFMTAVDGELDYEAGRIKTEDVVIEDLALQVWLDNGRMRLGPLQLDYLRPEQQTALSVQLDASDSSQDLGGQIQGRLSGEAIDASLRADAWLDLTGQGSTGSWELRASPGESRLHLAGDLSDLVSPTSLSLDVSASGPNAARLSGLFGTALPETPPFDVELALTRDGGRFILDDIDATLGDSDLDGRIAVDTDNQPTAVNIHLASDHLHLDDFLDLLDQRPHVEPKQLFPDRPLGLAELGRQLQGQLSYRAAQVVAARIPLSDVSLEARLRDRKLHLEPLRIGVGGGDLRLKLDLDTAADPPTADLDGKIRRIDLRRALDAYDIADESLGIVGGELRLWMQGRSPAELVGSADGGLFLLMTDGVFEQLLVELAGLDTGEAALALLEGDMVPIDCGFLNLHARDGQVEIETLAVDTRDTLFVGGGEIDLDRQWLNLVVDPRPKDASLLAFGSPLTLSGPLKAPTLKVISAELIGRTVAAVTLAAVTPVAALLPLIETGGGGSSPYCDGLMKQLREGYR